jgi:hypothetical protein
MRYLAYFLIIFVFFSNPLNSQVVESDYIRGDVEGIEVLGIEDEIPEEVEVEESEEEVLAEELPPSNQYPILDILAAFGGFAILFLIVYSIFSKRKK